MVSSLTDNLKTFRLQRQPTPPDMGEVETNIESNIEAALGDALAEVLPEDEPASGAEIDLNLLAKKVVELLKQDARIGHDRGSRARGPW